MVWVKHKSIVQSEKNEIQKTPHCMIPVIDIVEYLCKLLFIAQKIM
jgi:hypothetical protein